MSEEVQDVFGSALLDAPYGDILTGLARLRAAEVHHDVHYPSRQL
jgi:hypothetical protein